MREKEEVRLKIGKVIPPSGLEKGENISARSLLPLVGGHDVLWVFSLLYADVFLSFSLNFEKEHFQAMNVSENSCSVVRSSSGFT